MELPEIGRLERGVEDGSARWTTQDLTRYGINVIESERVGFRKWFTNAERENYESGNRERLETHENEEDSAGSRVSEPVRWTSLSTSQTTSPYQSTHEPHDSASTIASAFLDSSFRALLALSE